MKTKKNKNKIVVGKLKSYDEYNEYKKEIDCVT